MRNDQQLINSYKLRLGTMGKKHKQLSEENARLKAGALEFQNRINELEAYVNTLETAIVMHATAEAAEAEQEAPVTTPSPTPEPAPVTPEVPEVTLPATDGKKPRKPKKSSNTDESAE